MRAHALVILVHHRDGDGAIGPATHIGKAQVALGPYRLAIEIAKAQGVDQRRGMLDLPTVPTTAALP
jgi:hypothetical protein